MRTPRQAFPGGVGQLTIAIAVATLLTVELRGAQAQELKGRRAFETTCTPCHAFDKDAVPDIYGQTLNLYGVIGRKAASVPDFEYSEAMKATGRVWDAQAIDTFITAPKKFVPGTRMELPGVSDANLRKTIVEFLGTATEPGK
jgi:cytochrome c